MAQLDVNLLLDDPMFLDSFTVLRAAQTIGENGRVTSAPRTQLPAVTGSVQYESASETQKSDSGQFSPRNLKIWTATRILKASEGFSADQIICDNTLFEVLDVQSYANAGRGFFVVIARSIKVMDHP